MNHDFISPHEVPSSTVTIVQLSRMCLRGRLWWIFLFSHLCKNPRLCYTAGFALRAGCWYPLGRSHTTKESSGYTTAQRSALQRRQKNWGAEGTISFSSYRKLSQFLGSGVVIFGTDSRMIGPACMLKSDLWVYLCSSIFIQHDNNTEINQGKFFKFILDSWYPWGNYFDLILLKVLPELYCQSSFVAYKFIKKMPVADFLIRT